MRFLGLGLLLIACSTTHPPPLPTVALQADCADVTEARFPDTAVGQTAHLVLLAQRQDGGPDAAPVNVGIEGPDAASFAIADGSTCVLPATTPDGAPETRALADGEICSLAVSFAPTATGPQHATLVLGGTAVPLNATGVTYAPGLVASVRNVATLNGAIATPSRTEYLIINQGSSPITLGTIGTPGGGLTVVSTGPAGQTLTPGGAIHATLDISQATRGCAAGAFTIASTGNTLEIPITGRMVGGVVVEFQGAGTGRVVSSPPGIDCRGGDGVCARVFFEDHVDLTATAEDGSHFNGWGNACEHDATCALSPLTFDPDRGPVLGRASVAFASAQAKALRVSFAGGAPGIVTGTVTCSHDCTSWLEPGVTAALRAKTPATFSGWSGACTGASPACDLGVIINDRAATATFVPDDRAVQTLLDPQGGLLDPARSVGTFVTGVFASDGDLVIATSAQYSTGTTVISRQAPDGTARWSVPLARTIARAIGLDGTGAIYLLSDGEAPGKLVKLDPGGQEQWRRDAAVAGSIYLGPDALQVLPDGRVAVVGNQALRVFASDGSTSWSADASSCLPMAVAASPTNVVVIACTSGVLQRFDPAGMPLAAWAIPGNANYTHRVSMAFDAQGSLFVHATRVADSNTNKDESRVLARLDGTGAPVFTLTEPAPTMGMPWATLTRPGLRITASGQAFAYLPHRFITAGRIWSAIDAGGLLQTFSPTGTVSWEVNKTLHGNVGQGDPTWDEVSITDAACDRAGRCALLGGYAGRWIEVFSAP